MQGATRIQLLRLERPTLLKGIPDRTSGVSCAWVEPGLAIADWHELLCVVSLRRRGRLEKPSRKNGKQVKIFLHGLRGWRAEALMIQQGLRSHLGGAALSFGLGRLRGNRRVASEDGLSRTPGSEREEHKIEVGLGRLRFGATLTLDERLEETAAHCPSHPLLVGASRCSGQLWAGLTLALLSHDAHLPGVLDAKRIWVEIGADSIESKESSLRHRLDEHSFHDVSHLAFASSSDSWAVALAHHPGSNAMGSFIAPSQSHPRGYALPLNLVNASHDHLPMVCSVEGLIPTLLGGRQIDILVLHARFRDSEWLNKAIASITPLMGSTKLMCIKGLRSARRKRAARNAALDQGWEAAAPPAPLEYLLQACYRSTLSSSKTQPRYFRVPTSPFLLSDKVNSLGVHLQGSTPVAMLDRNGHVDIPASSKVWLEVGCNNWEMLLDTMPRDGSVWLLTLEPLVDKFAYIKALSSRNRNHLVLPFAVAPRHMGRFSAIRSQNYSDFHGRPGAIFQESGASSLLTYADGFKDHRWEGAEAHYEHFREYLVPTVTLEWVVGSLLGGRDVDFLKVDAQGLDFQVFTSLGTLARKVRRVQMELHSHIRHDGEVPCSQVVRNMSKLYGFLPVQGECAEFNPQIHDEADLVFERLEGWSLAAQ